MQFATSSITNAGKRAMLFLALLVVGLAPAALTSDATGVPDAVGTGVSAVSGFRISNVSYGLRDADPRLLDSVSFDLDRPATHVTAMVDNTRIACKVRGRRAQCEANDLDVRIHSITTLGVVASN